MARAQRERGEDPAAECAGRLLLLALYRFAHGIHTRLEGCSVSYTRPLLFQRPDIEAYAH